MKNKKFLIALFAALLVFVFSACNPAAEEEEEKVVRDVDHTRALEVRVQKALGRTIKINEKGKNHAITIGYSDNEDLEKLLKILCGDTFFDNI